jgi:hypothetical protein
MDQSTYVRPHLARKHLLRAEAAGETESSRNLNLKELALMNLPDEAECLQAVNSYLGRRGQLALRLKCHPLLISCFNCLLTPVLVKWPNVADDVAAKPATIQETLQRYVLEHGHNPSPFRLFKRFYEEQ